MYRLRYGLYDKGFIAMLKCKLLNKEEDNL